MNSSKTISKNSLKELYNESKKRIKIVLNLIGRVDLNAPQIIPDDRSFESISSLMVSIMNASHFENDNQYKDAIVEISTWVRFALDKGYLLQNKNMSPNPLFVIRKGCEILHSFLHRDLRRKQFSSEENEIYRNYLAMTKKLPNPKKEGLERQEPNISPESFLKKSG